MNIGIVDADIIGRSNHRFPNLACMKISGYHKGKSNNTTLIYDYKDLYTNENIWTEYQEAIVNYAKKQTEETNKILIEKMMVCFKKESFKYDKIFISKVFTDTEIDEDFLNLDFDLVEYGGTGFFYDKAEPLPDKIEHHMPDYHLYDKWVEEKIDNKIKKEELKKNRKLKVKEVKKIRSEFEYYLEYSIGFTTRGCFRQCGFCVNKNQKKVELHSPIEEFLDKDRKYICLLDDNILGYGQWEEVINSLIETNKPFQYKQGMDIRIMTEKKAKKLSEVKYRGDYIFAFDNIKDKAEIEEKLKLWRKYCSKTTKLYVFCGFDRNDRWDDEFWTQDIQDIFERVRILMKHGCLPYIMRFNKYEESPHRGIYINFARWCNQPNFFKKKSFREFCIANGSNSSCYNYMDSFENKHLGIAEKYYDLKYADYKTKI